MVQFCEWDGEPSALIKVGNFLTTWVNISCSKRQCTVKLVNQCLQMLSFYLAGPYLLVSGEIHVALVAVTILHISLLNWACHVAVTVIPELAPPVSHSREVPFYTNIKVIIPILVSLGFLLGLFGVAVFIHRKSKYECLFFLANTQFCTL